MNQEIKLNITGDVKITFLDSGKIMEFKNHLVPNAKVILSKLLAKQTIAIDQIQIRGRLTSNPDVDVILKEANIVSYTQNSNAITFMAIIKAEDFEGTIDALYLQSMGAGGFSELINLNIFKDLGNQVNIEWTLTINY